jgi:hypothetical protein
MTDQEPPSEQLMALGQLLSLQTATMLFDLKIVPVLTYVIETIYEYWKA